MKKLSAEYLARYYQSTRRENFAASQRLEGIITEATAPKAQAPLGTATLKLRYTKGPAAR
ncbi:MAG: YhfG family protein [Stenotrophomonas sp.]